jgi:hypothetical protein
MAKLEKRVIQANVDLKEDVIKILKTITNQLTMAINAKSRALHVGPPKKTLNYLSSIWYRNYNQYGRNDHFCQAPMNIMPMVPPQDCFQTHLLVGRLPQRIICFTMCNMSLHLLDLIGGDMCQLL